MQNLTAEEYAKKYYNEFNLTEEKPGFEEDNIENLKRMLEFGRIHGGVLKLPKQHRNCVRYIKDKGYKIRTKLDIEIIRDISDQNIVDYVLIQVDNIQELFREEKLKKLIQEIVTLY